MKKAIIFLFFMLSGSASGIDITGPYFHRLKFRNPTKDRIDGIIYGSEKIGYFRTRNFKVNKYLKIFDFIPPTYREPIQFFAEVRQNQKRILIGEKQFTNPTPNAIASIKPFYESGELAGNFLMTSASIPKQYVSNLDEKNIVPDTEKKNSNRFTFIITYNKFLEPVWAYAPHRNGAPFYSYVSFRKMSPNNYGFVLGKKDGLFMSIDSRGTVLGGIDGTLAEKKFPMHHDFTFKNSHTVLTFSNRYAKMRDRTGKRKLFLSNTIIEIDTRTNKVRKAFDFLKYMRPQTVGYWQENKFKPRWVVWDNINADHDFIHANSIEYYDNSGALISLKHLDKIVFIDPDLKKILWTVGPTAKDTFQATGRDRFSHQHDARLIGRDSILLFDNGFIRKKSRAMALKLNRKTKRAETLWEFSPKPSLYSENRGGVSKLENGLYLTHFVSPAGRSYRDKHTIDQDRVYIFNPQEKKIKCELVIPFRTRSAGYRSFLFDTIGSEEFIGHSIKRLQQGA